MKKQILIFIFLVLNFHVIGLTGNMYVNNRIPCRGKELENLIIIPGQAQQVSGIEVADLTVEEKKTLQLEKGVKVIHVSKKKTNKENKIREGFIILRLNNIPIVSKEQFLQIISCQNESIILLEGVYMESPSVCCYYSFEIN